MPGNRDIESFGDQVLPSIKKSILSDYAKAHNVDPEKLNEAQRAQALLDYARSNLADISQLSRLTASDGEGKPDGQEPDAGATAEVGASPPAAPPPPPAVVFETTGRAPRIKSTAPDPRAVSQIRGVIPKHVAQKLIGSTDAIRTVPKKSGGKGNSAASSDAGVAAGGKVDAIGIYDDGSVVIDGKPHTGQFSVRLSSGGAYRGYVGTNGHSWMQEHVPGVHGVGGIDGKLIIAPSDAPPRL
jgi:hypothetical protein